MGKPAVYNIVSNVDAIIILKNPCVEFAKWGEPAPLKVEKTAPSIADETVESENWKDWPIRLSKKDKKKKKKRWEQARDRTMDQAQLIGEVAITPDIGGPSSSSIVPEVSLGSTQPSIFGAGPSEIIGTVAREDKDSNSLPIDIEARKAKRIPKATMKSNQEDGIRFRVCAGNLMSASPWFNRTLKRDGWKESDWNQEDKCYYISARDWDEEAFLILMNIFHLRNRDVPRKVTLETLAKIAVLADYYECSESIELFVDMWVADLQANTSVPATYCRDLILWIWVSWAFKMLEIFTQVTRTAIKQCDEPCRNLGLPIPARVTNEIDQERYQAIESIISRLYAQLEVYRGTSYSCPFGTQFSFRCGCMLLGALTKEMHRVKLMSPRPEIPFSGHSLDSICVRIRSMKSELWWHNAYDQHECNISSMSDSIVEWTLAMAKGLNMNEKH